MDMTIGDIAKMEINPEDGLIVHSGAYIASTSDVILDTQWQGFTKGLFGSELFMLKVNRCRRSVSKYVWGNCTKRFTKR